MARSWHYPRWRSYVMQGVMVLLVLVLLGVGMALNASQWASRRAPLGEPVRVVGITIALPEGWEVTPTDSGLELTPPGARDAFTRSLSVMVTENRSPLERLGDAALDALLPPPGGLADVDNTLTFDVNGTDATLVTGTFPIALGDFTVSRYAATATLEPANDVKVVVLFASIASETNDPRAFAPEADLVRRMTESIRLTDADAEPSS